MSVMFTVKSHRLCMHLEKLRVIYHIDIESCIIMHLSSHTSINCSIVWSTTSGYNMMRLIKLQKRAARLILECPVRTSSEDTFSELKWMTLPERIKFRKLTMVYKAIHHQCPAYITEMFQGVNAVHSRTTRNAEEGNLYPTTFAKLEALNKTFKHSSIEAWNTLPTHIKEAQSVHSFKRLYSDYYFGNRQIAE